MQSEDLSNEKEEQKPVETVSETTEVVKKVKISKPLKRTVKVKAAPKKEEAPQAAPQEEVQLELPLENTNTTVEAPSTEHKAKKTKRTSTDGKPKSNYRRNTRTAKKTTEQQIQEDEAVTVEQKQTEVIDNEIIEETYTNKTPVENVEVATDAENTEVVTPEEGEAKGSEEKEVTRNPNNRFNRNNKNPKYNNNKKDKFKNNNNNNNRRPQEEYPAEISAVDNPEAPRLFLSELLTYDLNKLRDFAREKGISEEEILECRKQDLIEEILKNHTASGGVIMVVGTIEVLPDGYGLIRYAINSYLSSSEDVYIPQNQIKANGLRTGDEVFAQVRTPREYDRSYVIFKVINVNGDTPQTAKLRAPFDSLTPLFPDERLHLEVIDTEGKADISTRVVDLFCPIGKGQRSLIVAPPRTGKTVLMQKIANSITANHPDVKLIVLLVDERPEEVTDMRRHVNAEVVASTFDEQATRHVQVAEMVIEKAKRLVEYHKDVVILLDSITRLARAYNQTVPASGKILSGGVDSNALHKPKRFFGAARNIENGGSLTIISTALIETGSRMDEVIFEEFKGTGNNEIVLDRRMADSRKFPAINVKKSGTRRDDLLLTKDEQTRIWLLRNAVANMDDVDMSVFLIDKMKKTSNNKEFLASISGNAVSNANNSMGMN